MTTVNQEMPMATVNADQTFRTVTLRAREFAGDKVASLESVMREYPLATVAIGLGFGYLLGRLMARS